MESKGKKVYWIDKEKKEDKRRQRRGKEKEKERGRRRRRELEKGAKNRRMITCSRWSLVEIGMRAGRLRRKKRKEGG
jgi:hypothetical protein